MSPFDPLRRLRLTGYFVIAYAWTWTCWWAVAGDAAGRLSLPVPRAILATLGQFGPFVAAVVTAWATGGTRNLGALLARVVRWKAGPAWVAVSLLMLPATMLGAILAYDCLHGGGPVAFRDEWDTLPAHFVFTLLLCGPLGEEPGWRGFALPRLQARYGPMGASIWLGLLWAGWHGPLWFIYPAPCPFLLYAGGAVPMTVLFTWLFNHTRGSVFYSLLFHASMSTASARLPEVPAYHYWVLCLFACALAVWAFDRRLGWIAGRG